MKKVEDATLADLLEALQRVEELSLPDDKEHTFNGSTGTVAVSEQAKGLVSFISCLAAEILKPIHGQLPGQAFCLLAASGFVAMPATELDPKLKGYVIKTRKGNILFDFDD